MTRVCGRSSGLNENTRSALATASLERDVCVTSAKPHPAPPVPSPHPAPPQERSLRPPRSAPRGRGERRPRGRGLLVTCAHQRTQAQPHAAGRGRAISSKILSWGVTARTAKNVEFNAKRLGKRVRNVVAKIYAALPAPQHFLNFLLLPQLQGSLGFTRADFASVSPGAYDGGCRVKWCGLRLVIWRCRSAPF